MYKKVYKKNKNENRWVKINPQLSKKEKRKPNPTKQIHKRLM